LSLQRLLDGGDEHERAVSAYPVAFDLGRPSRMSRAHVFCAS
jgi:hypothetical protein